MAGSLSRRLLRAEVELTGRKWNLQLTSRLAQKRRGATDVRADRPAIPAGKCALAIRRRDVTDQMPHYATQVAMKHQH
jgi:hypothetical protein